MSRDVALALHVALVGGLVVALVLYVWTEARRGEVPPEAGAPSPGGLSPYKEWRKLSWREQRAVAMSARKGRPHPDPAVAAAALRWANDLYRRWRFYLATYLGLGVVATGAVYMLFALVAEAVWAGYEKQWPIVVTGPLVATSGSFYSAKKIRAAARSATASGG
jgi:hypothetical protein